MPFFPIGMCSTQTVHVGGSSYLLVNPFFEALRPPGAIGVALQCFSSILMIGNLLTAETLACFFFLYLSAASSDILLTISKMLSSGLKLES